MNDLLVVQQAILFTLCVIVEQMPGASWESKVYASIVEVSIIAITLWNWRKAKE